jgi:hypothetical protein
MRFSQRAFLVSAVGSFLASALGCDSSETGKSPPGHPEHPDSSWVGENTIALRHQVPAPSGGERLSAAALLAQLQAYDPGSQLRCAVQDDPAYRAAVDSIGGVSWGYSVSFLEDESKPKFLLGPAIPQPVYDAAESGARVEIEKADIVGLSESAALFYSSAHGLLLVDLSQPTPRFKCAAKLPGDVRDFYYYQGHLVVMAGTSLLHFKVSEASLTFVELVSLDGPVLDTRRFNDRLVVYTSIGTEQPSVVPSADAPAVSGTSGDVYVEPSPHRSLRVFKFGEQLTEELHESLRNTAANRDYLSSDGAVPADTQPGAVVHTGRFFGDALWASDHYFVVTEAMQTTKFASWATQTYNACTAGHATKHTERSCSTTYETRPNPDYTPPDNSGGDRACKGTTLADCLHAVARASNPTIQVPAGTKCEDIEFEGWSCDTYEWRTYTYPQFEYSTDTRLSIFEYTDAGFVRLDSKVHEITTPGLDELKLDDQVDALTTSDEAFDLSLPGDLQTLYFQDGFLYAISKGVLQVYSMGNGSLVRTSTTPVVGDSLQTSLFSEQKLYLSDYSYSIGWGDHSVLRVFDLSNPAFPRQASEDHRLPGGHASILPMSSGILTTGAVTDFEGTPGYVLKVGLFTDPFASEQAYLILGTDLEAPMLGASEGLYFDRAQNRLFLPYVGWGRGDSSLRQARVGVSHVQGDKVVSEGALHLPESVDRVRPRPGVDGQVLGFGQNSISLFTPAEAEWTSTSLLSYYTPSALYRISDQDDYVEVLRLGSSCKLHFAKATQLNLRDEASTSEPFDCGHWQPSAYANNIIFSETTGVSFDQDGAITRLDAAQIAALNALRARREVCLYSETPTNDPIDYASLPPVENLRCYSPEEYQELPVR